MRVVLAYKNFAANRNISHIGLGVAALNTCKVLQANGIQCDVWPILNANDLRANLLTDKLQPEISHVVISAPWVPTLDLQKLCRDFPRIEFAVSSHSNLPFLSADTNGMKLFREALDLEMALPNFKAAANSEKMCLWVSDAYGNPCQFLPNLYFLRGPQVPPKPLWNGGQLRIGVFGATRPQKNLVSGVGAAVELAYQLKAQTLVSINTGRAEGGGNVIINTIREMVRGIPNITLSEAGWSTWPAFRRLVGSQHLLISPSYTESFCMVTADGVAEGVASVASEAITWVPDYWKANIDEVFEIASVGRGLLMNPRAPYDGDQALRFYISNGIRAWKSFLTSTIHIQ